MNIIDLVGRFDPHLFPGWRIAHSPAGRFFSSARFESQCPPQSLGGDANPYAGPQNNAANRQMPADGVDRDW